MGKRTNKPYYNRTNTCDRCREEGIETKIYPNNALREHDENGNWTGKWYCRLCHERYDPNSRNNIIKSLANCRTGNQNPNSEQAKGDNFEELTCRWRSKVSTVPVENLNKKLNNRHSPIDHSWDSELGFIQTKGRLYNSIERLWPFNNLEGEWNNNFDVIICYCASKDGKIIEIIYIIPKKEIKDKRTGISIYKNPTDSHGNPKISWYDKYRIIDEEIIKEINDIWQLILKEKGNDSCNE